MAGQRISRRRFLGTVASAGAAFMVVPRHVLGRGFVPPSDRLNIACIGVGGRGAWNVRGVASETLVAFCDVDDERAADTYRAFPDVPRYKDFRVMLEREEKRIDAVVISTPDHTHAPAAMMAIQMGKHVYCEKPLTRTIYEARRLAEAAREKGVVTQMGNQGHAGEGTRQIREWIEAGAIGTVREIHCWTNRPIWPQAIKRPLEAYHVPLTLDWDLWLGPAPERPYHPAYLPFKWRGWWDFGTGALGDMGCHIMDAAFWTFDLRDPVRVTAETTPVFPETAPLVSRVIYEFEARDSRPALRLIWRDGSLAPPRPPQWEKDRPWPPMANGQMFVGDEGVLIAETYGENPRLIPERRHQEWLADAPEPRYPRSPGVYQEWIQACKEGGQAGSNFPDYAGPLTEMVLLGNLAVRLGGTIEWDAAAMRVTNIEVPEEYIRPTYRPGWPL
ncbi:Tat (twin-arginine translocation) pathway signal sequence [Rhodothermus profundi]|uniref:Tat (Twin-arginine translocation) pathway signal sequence n=1 Tax=Rhodothermus profundi TaxID=633813 RepID=A0A1M6WDX4_9BACT|nr:Tat (twin-arginine translocation) pathway signal sequence [Rhodothermus profundi]